MVLSGPVAAIPYIANVLWLGFAYYFIHTNELFNFVSVVLIGDLIGYALYQLLANNVVRYQLRVGFFTEAELEKMLAEIRARKVVEK